MKLYIKASTDKAYSVSAYTRRYKGKNGASEVQSWVLEAHSLKSAKDFGYDVLAGLSIEEIFEGNIDTFKSFIDNIMDTYGIDRTTPIGYDIAENEFTIKSSKEY